MREIRVDFNNRGANRTVRGSLRRADGISVGDRVLLIDDDEDEAFEARVVSVDVARNQVLFAPEWETAPAPATWFDRVSAHVSSTIVNSGVFHIGVKRIFVPPQPANHLDPIALHG